MSIDKESLTALLEMQQKAYKDASELLFNSLNNRIEDQNRTIYELKKSLEYSQQEIEGMKSKVTSSQNEINELKRTVNDQNTLIEKLKNQQEQQEDYSRRKNIRIEGVIDNFKENNEQTQLKIEKIIKDNLGIENIDIEIAHRINRKNNPSNKAPRTIIAKLKKASDRDTIMRSTRKLKDSGIFINEDFCEATMKIRKELFPKVKEARDKGLIAYIKGRSLVTKSPQGQIASKHKTTTASLEVTPKRNESLSRPPSPLIIKDNSDQAQSNERRKSQRNKT